jgi:hypothetical protein
LANPFTTTKLHGDEIILNGVNVNAEFNSVLEAVKANDYLNIGRNFAQVFVVAIIDKKEEENLFLF